MGDDLVYVDYEEVERETPKAYLIDGLWWPKSQVKTVEGDRFWVPRWLAEEKEVPYHDP